MLKTIITSKLFLITLFILVVATFTVSIIKTKVSPPVLISTVPSENSKNISVLGGIALEFNEKISVSDFTINSSPEETWTISQKDDFTLIAKADKTLKSETKYQLNLNWKTTSLDTLFYTTEKNQTDYELINDIKAEVARDYPLSKFTPYDAPQLSAVYGPPLTMEITIKNSNLSSQEAIDQVKNWIKDNGGDVDAHKYIIVSAKPKLIN